MKLEPPPSRLFHTPMVSRCHSRVWCVGLGPAHPQVVANQNHLRSYSKALLGASRWMRQCIGPGVRRHGNPSITVTPGRACRQSPLPGKKKKKIISFWASCEHIQSPKKHTKHSPFSFFIYSFAFLSCPGSLLPLYFMGKALIQDRQITPGSTQGGKCKSFCSSD